jgi:C1A family cysteine protease
MRFKCALHIDEARLGVISMKSLFVFLFTIACLAALFSSFCLFASGGSASAEEQTSAEQFRKGGFIPPEIDLGHLRRTRVYLPKTLMQPPASWDWRSLGGMTSVKNQGTYSTCWAFAAIGDIESKMLIDWGLSRDFSEHNVVACAPNQFYLVEGASCFTGGNAYISTSYLSRLGTVDETCDEYPGNCPSITCFNPNCYFRRQVTEWIVIVGDLYDPSDEILIKEAIMNHGPVYTAMFSQWAEFQSYDTDTCLTYSGTEDPDHAVLIVGWDDAMCDGSGAWIVKNSWGAGWGDSGYFYIRYGDANIGSYTSVITDYKYFNEMEEIYFYDDYGFTGSYGWSDENDWGMVVMTPSWSGDLHAVDFWATSAPTTYTIYVYDDFNGISLSNLMAGPVSGTLTESGFYSIDLPSPPPADMSDPIYIAVNFQTPGHGFPIPIDTKSPRETNKCYASNHGTDFYALDAGNWNVADVAIRGRVVPHCTFIFPQLDIEFIGTERIMIGMNEGIRYFIEVVNRGTVDDVLFEDAPDLWPYTAENSRSWIPRMRWTASTSMPYEDFQLRIR